MKLATMTACLALLTWLAQIQSAPLVPSAPRPIDATVTRDGEVVSVSIPSPRLLRFSAQRANAEAHFDLELTALPEGGRLIDARLGAFGERGLAAIVTIERGGETEYRWLFTTGDPLRGSLDQGDPLMASRGTGADAPWNLSAPLFTSTGETYRLVDVHNSGGDSLEMTFRRGELKGVRERSAGLAVDERIIHDVCPIAGNAISGSSVQAIVERVVPNP